MTVEAIKIVHLKEFSAVIYSVMLLYLANTIWELKISYLNWINLYNVISVQMIVNCHITVSSVFSRPLTDFT